MYLVVTLAIFVVLLVLAVQNPEPVAFRFLGWGGMMPLVMIILGSAMVGAAAASIPALMTRFRLGRKLKEATAQVKRLQQELEDLRCRQSMGAPAASGAPGQGTGSSRPFADEGDPGDPA